MDRPPRLSQELPGTQMQLLAFSSHAPLPVLPADLCDSRHCAHCSPSAGHQSQGILGASCWGQLTLLWTALSWFPLPTLASLKLFVSQASTIMVSLCPAAGPPSASLTHCVARCTDDMGWWDLTKTALVEVLPPRSFSSLSGGELWESHLAEPHMHDVQHGAGSVRSGHWAPTVCQHVLPASPHQRAPVVSLMKDPQGLPISPCNKPNLFTAWYPLLFIPSHT